LCVFSQMLMRAHPPPPMGVGLLRRTGFDNRTSMGLETIQLVAPWDRHTGAIGILRIQFVPEPSGSVMLIAGVTFLVVVAKRRRQLELTHG